MFTELLRGATPGGGILCDDDTRLWSMLTVWCCRSSLSQNDDESRPREPHHSALPPVSPRKDTGSNCAVIGARKRGFPSMRRRAPQAISPVSFHPAKKKKTRQKRRQKIIQSGLFREFYSLLIASPPLLRSDAALQSRQKGAADFISIMTPIPRGITGDGTFCTPPKPLPSVEHSSSVACQTAPRSFSTVSRMLFVFWGAPQCFFCLKHW